MDEHLHSSEVNPEVHHEERDVNVTAILWFTGAFIVSAVIIHIGLYFLFHLFADQERAKMPPPISLVTMPAKPIPPEPRLQDDPVRDMVKMVEDEREGLTGYGWVDPQKGTVRIPIDRAMKVVVESVLPVRPSEIPPPPPPPPPPAEVSQ